MQTGLDDFRSIQVFGYSTSQKHLSMGARRQYAKRGTTDGTG